MKKKVATNRFSKAKVQTLLQGLLKRREGKHNGSTTDKKRKAVNSAVKKLAESLGIVLDYSHLAWFHDKKKK